LTPVRGSGTSIYKYWTSISYRKIALERRSSAGSSAGVLREQLQKPFAFSSPTRSLERVQLEEASILESFGAAEEPPSCSEG